MKGGTLIVGGDVGYMTGFMMQKGVLIVGGDAGEALGDSLYEGKIYIRGKIEALGSDAVQADLTDADIVAAGSRLGRCRHGHGPCRLQEDRFGQAAVQLRQERKGDLEDGSLSFGLVHDCAD